MALLHPIYYKLVVMIPPEKKLQEEGTAITGDG
jgi:hypothetical protein